MLMELCVKSINDLDNRSTAPGFAARRIPIPEIAWLTGTGSKIRAIGMRVTKKDNRDASLMTLRRKLTRR